VATQSKSFSRFLKKLYYFSKLDGVISYDKVAKQATHITDLYADCFGQLLGLGPGDLDGPRMLKIKFDDAYATEARGKLMQLKSGHQSARTLFINHLSTSVKKDYPWAKVVDLIQRLSLKDPQLAFIVNTPPDMFEQVQADICAEESLAKLPVMAFTATDNFFQLPAMMAQCDLVISVDTATTHLAACLQIPLITLIADKDSLWTAQGKGQILTGDPRAGTISPATVVETYAKLIELS
jgi:ADP-heptose:LPS heptosyltransferase